SCRRPSGPENSRNAPSTSRWSISRWGRRGGPAARDAAGPPRLPHLLIDHLEVDGAFLEFSGPDGRLQERIARLDLKAAVRSDGETVLLLRGSDVEWQTHASSLGGLRGEVRLDDRGISAEQLSGTLNGNPVRAEGTRGWDGSLDLAVSGRGVSVAEVEDLIGQTIGFVAAGDLDGTFVTRGDTLVYAGVFSGELEGFRMERLEGSALISETEVLLQGMSGRVNGAGFDGGGRIDIRDPANVTFVLEGDVTDVDLAKGLVPGEQDLPPTGGRGRLRIEHADNPEWTRVSGVLYDGFVDILPFDQCLVDVTATPDTVYFDRIEVWYRDLHGLLTGEADAAGVFAGNVSATSEDLGSLPAAWGLPALGGRLTGLGEVSGPLERLGFAGWLDLHDFRVGEVAAGRAEAALVVDDVLGDPAAEVGVDGDGFSVGGVPLGRFTLRGGASRQGARVDSFRADRGDTSVALRLDAVFTDSLQTFSVASFRVALEGTDWELQQPVAIGVGDGLLTLGNLEIASDQGSVAASGRYERDGRVRGALQVQGLDLGLLDPFVRTDQPLAGRLSANVIVDGATAEPQVHLTAELTDAPFALARVDSLHLMTTLSEGVFDLRELDLRTSYGRVQVSGAVAHPGTGPREFWPGAGLDLRLLFTDCDWAFLEQFRLPALDRLAGTFSGDLTLAGTTDAPLFRGEIASEPFHLHWLHLDRLTGQVWADSDALVLGGLRGSKFGLALTGRIEVPLELDLLSEPVTPLDGPFYMQLEIPPDSDLAPLAAATNAFVQASGRGSASVVISGPLSHPLYQGSLRIRNAGFVIRNLEEIYYETSCDGEFRGDELVVKNIRGREGLRGRFSGGGRVVFAGLELRTFDIRLDVDRFLVASLPDLRMVVSGKDARLTGVKVGPDSLLVPKFSGSLDVVKGHYTGDFSETAGGVDPLQATVAPDWLADLRLSAEPRSARIINREMELDLGGDLDLVRDEGGLYLRGTLDVNAGQLIVFSNKFKVLRGRLDFSRALGFDPRMDVDAETSYRLRSQYSSNSVVEHIGVHVGGTLREPIITFTSERGYSREAIQRMLLGLEPYATPEGDTERLRNTGISAGFNVIEREIARELALFDTFEIDQIQRERETGGTGLDPLIGVGKYIGSDLYLKYAQGIRQDDRDVIVEYQINQHLLLQSEVRRRIDENQGQPTYNLDFKYRFEY
ncbi:MAG: translocation/assembly module TamB domain-containing protein, partial [Krumholzibacteria bacterium]|nr:translocation/assembly module TamB domain-containing protein [Candidatus Krumholzibacteria bacterium]